MTHTFILRRAGERDYLMLAIRDGGRRIVVSTSIALPAGLFDTKAQSLVKSRESAPYIYNIRRWSEAAREVTRISITENLSLEDTKKMILEKMGKASPEPEKREPDFYAEFERFVGTATTKRKSNIHLKQSYRVFREFAGGRKLTFGRITPQLTEEWIEWMAARGLAPNTRGGHIKTLKAFMRETNENGLHTNTSYTKFRKEKEETDAVYLTMDEIQRIEEAQCRGMEEKARDMFLIGCYTGQRYSDCATMKLSDLRDGYLYIIQRKTRERVVIPAHPAVVRILEKWNGAPCISEQKENQAIKQLCRSLGMNNIVSVRKSGKVEQFEKWELVTTHTARRSCITNLHLSGVSLTDIMRISGHRSQSVLNTYLKMTAEDTARKLKDCGFFNGKNDD